MGADTPGFDLSVDAAAPVSMIGRRGDGAIDGETTPLYARFGLSQRSDNSSILSSTFASENSPPPLEPLAGEEGSTTTIGEALIESNEVFEQNHGARAVDIDDVPARDEAALYFDDFSDEEGELLAGADPRGGLAEEGPRSDGADGRLRLVERLLVRAAKRPRRIYVDAPRGKNHDDGNRDGSPCTKRRRFWIRCDGSRLSLMDHIHLMNSNVAGSGHRCLTVLGLDSKHARTEEQAGAGAALHEHDSLCAGGFWAAYFPMCELQHVWSNLVSGFYFWGDRFAKMASVRLVTSLAVVRAAQSRLSQRRRLWSSKDGNGGGDEGSDKVGFDTMLRLVERGDVPEDEHLCCVTVPCSPNATLGEIRRAGVALLAALPGSYGDGPVHYKKATRASPPGKGASPSRKLAPAVRAEDDHVRESILRICRETVPKHVRISSLATICGRKRPRSDESEWSVVSKDTRKDFVLYKLSGIVWKVCKDESSLWSA